MMPSASFQHLVRVCLLVLAWSLPGAARAVAQNTVVIARIAAKDHVNQRFAEVFHEHGRWVFPDVGYIDFGDPGGYREFFAGLGRTLVRSPKATVVGEMYFLQATGEASGSARYLLPWVLVDYRPSPNVHGEAVYFPYVPLNGGARLQHVVERAKLEYLFDVVKVGGGYGAYDADGLSWQHRPFVTMTLMPPRLGEIEFWLQRVPGGTQFQVRYLRVFR